MTALPVMLAWLRARVRYDQRGGVNQNVLLTILVVLAILAVLFWLLTSFHVSKK